MADLSNIFGGPWSPPPEKIVASPEQQLIDAMFSIGLTPPDQILMDGKIHRFKSGTKGSGGHGDKPGWYLIFGDGIPAGRFGCWRMGVEQTFRADVGRKLSDLEEMTYARRLGEAKTLRDAEIQRKHEVAADTVEKIWVGGGLASPDHPYLQRKGIKTHGARITGDGRLMVPLYGLDGVLSSIQYIDADGNKLYHPGGQTGGKYLMIGTMDEPGILYLAEGFATAATIHETTNRPCVVAYSASNLVPVTGILRELYGVQQSIIIVADNDASGVGQRYAEQSCAKFGAEMILPPIQGDANDYVKDGHDLLALLNPPIDGWLVPIDDFCSKPSPISWLVKRWVQSNALVMVHGPSGGGKTFVVLDWCLRMASNTADWCGNKVKGGNVVYLAGEGHHGLRGRVAAWKQHHNVTSAMNMWLSKDGCDLNTAAGYLKVVQQIRTLPNTPQIIVVDTLHRFLSGDENSAQDAKTMLDSCNNLMNEFDCSVILVHHTGVSEEAQHRARGSSAWRGALDIEISVVPSTDTTPMKLVQRKSKDAEMAEPVFLELQSVAIHGWMDEDNQPVSSAVVIASTAPVKDKKDSKTDGFRKLFENAWFDSGAEVIDGQPYLSRSALKEKLAKDGNAERTVRNMINPSYTDKLIGYLTQSGMIQASEHGWKMVDEVETNAMILRKNN